MKKRLVSAMLAITTAFSMTTSAFAATAKDFKDVPSNAWFTDAVDYAVSHNMFSGVSADQFSPSGTMTRAMFVTVLARMNGVNASTVTDNKKFSDVDFSTWYGSSVVWGNENGIISGTSDTTFGPNASITREQIAVILYRYLSKLDMTMPTATNAPASFKDAAKISPFAKEAVEAMRQWGFVAGNDLGNYNPQAKVTRAEAAAILMRVNYFIENGTSYVKDADIDNGNNTPSENPSDDNSSEVTSEIKSMKFASDTYTVKVGEDIALFLNMTPANVLRPYYKIESSDSNIVDVSPDGMAYGEKVGTATITASSDNGVTTTCTINVVDNAVPATSVSFDKSEVSLKVGQAQNIVATVAPANSTDGIYNISSSDDSIVEIRNGAVVGVKAGTATVTATTANGKTATCKVTVSNASAEASGIDISESSKSASVGSTFKLTATVKPESASNRSVSWDSSDVTVAMVDNGKVTCVGEGTATITAKISNGKTATCKVTVAGQSVVGLTINRSTINLYPTKTAQLNVYAMPTTIKNVPITWSSSDDSIATVSNNGTVTAKKIGTATITAKTSNGKSVTCIVTVPDAADIAVESVSLDKSTASIEIGGSVKLNATINPNNAKDKNIEWTSSDDSVATVKAGTVTAVKAGSATITAKTANGKSATCKITVTTPVKASFSVTKEINIKTSEFDDAYEDDEYVGTIKITDDVLKDEPTVAGFLPYTFESSDTSIIKVNENGKLYSPVMIKAGDSEKVAYITTKNTDDGSTQKTKVTVTSRKSFIVDDQYISEYATEMLRLVNEARTEAGINPLSYMNDAQDCANTRALELSENLSHTRPNGKGFQSIAAEMGVSHNFSGENILSSTTPFMSNGTFYISESAKSLANATFTNWMSSTGHRANILNSTFEYFVVGLACGDNYDTDSIYDYASYAVQLFSAR